jgi:DNA-binding NarL/FixJ family response regulator
MINVLIVDDQNLTHRLIETYLEPDSEIHIVGFAHDGQEAIEQIPRLQPDVILMDVEMPKMDGLTATKIITQQFPQSKVLILTVHDNEQHLSTALTNGAKGYLLKNTTAQELKNAIYYVNQGYFQLSVELTEKYLQKIITSKSEVEEVSEIKRKVNYVYKSLDKIENRLKQIKQNSNEDLREHLEVKIQDIIQAEMRMVHDHDSNLQFKVDRMKHSQERLEKSVSYLFKIQIACIVAALLFSCYLIFSSLN